MKTLITILFLSAKLVSLSQDVNSFKKYSYPITICIGKNAKDGTAFLFKKENKIFLVSNYHVLRGMDPFEQKVEWAWDSAVMKYYSKIVNGDSLLGIDISEKKLGKVSIFSPHENIDIFAVQIDSLPQNGDFNFINELIDTAYFTKNTDEIFLWGFPASGRGSKSCFDVANIGQFKAQISPGFEDYKTYMRNKYTSVSSSYIDVVLLILEKNYYFTLTRAEGGFSGSPCFGKFAENGKFVYKFYGVVFGEQKEIDRTWFIKPQIVLNYLNSLK